MNQSKSTETQVRNVHVEQIKRLDGTGNIKAYVTVRIDNLFTINSVRVMQLPGKEPWVVYPQIKGTDQRYYSMITVHDVPLYEAIQEAVLTAWRGGRHD